MRSGTHALRWTAAIVCLACVGAWPRGAAAQSLSDLHLGRWEGSLGFEYLVDHERLRFDDATPPTTFDRRRWSEQASVFNRGITFVDPRLAWGSLGLTLGLIQDRENDGEGVISHDTRLLGYELDLMFLSGLPYNARLFAHRTQRALTQPFGYTDSTLQNFGTSLHLREDSPLRDKGWPYTSANLSFEQQRTSETTTSVIGQSFRRDETQNRLSLDGHRGFETADLDARYDFTDLHDAAFPQTDFQGHALAVNHSIDFGPTLNRRSDSRLFMYRRNGMSPTTLLTANETLSIAHRNDLATDYRYSFSHTDTQAGRTTAHEGSFEVRYKPFGNLETNAQVLATLQELSSGSRDTYGGLAGARYRYDLPWDGKLDAHANARYRVDDNRLSASAVSVVDEAQSAPSSLGAGAGFLLTQPFVVSSSIQVVDLRGGARLPAVLGLDYEVVSEGSRTRIVPLATSALIAPGDPLAVSYTYEVDPSIKFATLGHSGGVSLGFRWIDFAYDRDDSNERLLAGVDNGFLEDVRRESAKVGVHGSWPTFDARASALRGRYDSQRLVYVENRYDGLLTWRPTRFLSLAFNANRALTDYELPEHRTRSLSAQLTFDWHLRWGFSANGMLGRRVYEDTLQPTEVINEARLGARLNYGKLSITSSAIAAERDRGGARTSNWGFAIGVTRRF